MAHISPPPAPPLIWRKGLVKTMLRFWVFFTSKNTRQSNLVRTVRFMFEQEMNLECLVTRIEDYFLHQKTLGRVISFEQ
jgi:hypothetical protein